MRQKYAYKRCEALKCAHLSFVALDSSIGILGRVQLEGASSPADIVLGLDTNLMATARKTGLLAPHGVDMTGRTTLPVDFNDDVFVPFDWGYFSFVYNSETLSDLSCRPGGRGWYMPLNRCHSHNRDRSLSPHRHDQDCCSMTCKTSQQAPIV